VTLTKTLYTAAATVTGGRAEGRGVTDDRALDVRLAFPVEMGGTGEGTNPEQLFAVGYAACFEGALGVVCRRDRTEPGDVSIESIVRLINTGGDAWNIAVELRVTLPGVTERERAAQLVADAHEICAYSNATRGNIELKLVANGFEVALATLEPASVTGRGSRPVNPPRVRPR
jgi:lipoyl-dependent peroxiredoxin